MPSQDFETPNTQIFDSAESDIDSKNLKESQQPTVEQRLKETQKMLKQLEQWGVHSTEQIDQEGKSLEINYQQVIKSLKEKLGNAPISEGSQRLVHQHLVDDVINFRQHVLERFTELQKSKQQMLQKETKEEIKAPNVATMAAESNSIGEFKRKLRSAADDNPKNLVLEQAATNMSKIATGHEHYAVEEKLDDLNGLKTAGITEMDENGGGKITISAEHLADITTKEGRDEIKMTLKHEAIHGDQARLKPAENGVAVVDPTTGREMTETELHEGGAVHGTKDLGSEKDETAAPVYKQGANFYKRNDAKIIDEHLSKKGEHAGDRVHLQAELAKKEDVKDPKKLKTIAKKAGFTEIETARFLKLMKIKGDDKQKERLAA